MKFINYICICLCLMLVACNKSSGDKLAKAKAEKAWRSTAPSPAPARKIELGKSTSFTLDNGLQVIVVENHKLPRVSYQLSLAHDPIIEGEQAGYVQIAGSLLKTGTKSKSKSDIDEAIDFIGASLNTTGNGIFASSLTKHQDKLLDLMSDILYNPSFKEEEFEKIKKQTISGIATSKTDPNQMASNVSSVLNYGSNHPYGEIQSEATVSNIGLESCKSYYQRYFKPNNAYLVVVGDITPAQAKLKVMKHFGMWEKGEIPMQKYEAPKIPSERKVAFVNKDGAVQSVIRVTYPIDLKPGDDKLMSATVMNSILGGGIFSGRLMQNLREDKAYTYGARSNISSDKLVGNFAAYASVRNEVTDSSVHEFLYELNRIRTEPVSSEDLQLSINSLAGGFARSLESPQTIARFALNTAKYKLPADYYSTYLERLEAVTVGDISIAARDFIHPSNAYIVVAGSQDEVAESLLQFDSDGKIDFYDAFGKEVKMDAVLPEGLTAQNVIDDYISAIGGQKALASVKTLSSTGSMDLMGQSATMNLQQKSPNKMAMKLAMGPMVMQEQVFNGTKAKVGQMGQSKVVSEGEEFDAAKEQAQMFPQLNYSKGYTLELKGIESIDGIDAYKIKVTKPSGKSKTQFYNASNGLLIREVEVQGAGEQTATIITDISDYKTVDGIMFPHKMVINGAMPVALTMTIQNVTLNKEIADTVFTVE